MTTNAHSRGTTVDWTPSQLDELSHSNDFHIAPYRDDVITPGTMIWVWSVVVNGAVYVRSGNPHSRWFAAAMRQRAGLASGGGFTGQVQFSPVTEEAVIDLVDDAFRAKYATDDNWSEDLMTRSRKQIACILLL